VWCRQWKRWWLTVAAAGRGRKEKIYIQRERTGGRGGCSAIGEDLGS